MLGQPNVENGHSHDENHVSSTSSSWRTAAPQAGQVVMSVRDAIGSMSQLSQYHTGMRCPHQICREIFQSRMPSSQFTYTASQRSGRMRNSPERNACKAGAASGAIFTNQRSDKRG